jgi:tetratricopeptide (TPR) repeat protein
VADCHNGLAEASRFRGDLEAATLGYERALQLMEAIGSGTAVIVRINLGLVLLARGRYAAAERPLQSARAALLAHGRLSLLACVHTELLPCAAAAGRWAEWDQHMETAARLLQEAPMVDPDIAWPTELGADLARAAGEEARARGAYELALSQWKALRNDAAVERVTAVLKV